jgi:hypothetical protein
MATPPNPDWLTAATGLISCNIGILSMFKQSVGPLDVAVEANTLLERFGPHVVVVEQTLEESRAKVNMQLEGNVFREKFLFCRASIEVRPKSACDLLMAVQRQMLLLIAVRISLSHPMTMKKRR